MDYIFGGCEIGLHIAIDYTLSNLSPKDPNSYHYINNRTKSTQYLDAIMAVLEILKDFDSNQMFAVYGFGGVIPSTPDKKASHCFALNGDFYAPEVNGTEGVFQAYKNSLSKVELNGPTNFAEFINLLNGFASYQ